MPVLLLDASPAAGCRLQAGQASCFGGPGQLDSGQDSWFARPGQLDSGLAKTNKCCCANMVGIGPIGFGPDQLESRLDQLDFMECSIGFSMESHGIP